MRAGVEKLKFKLFGKSRPEPATPISAACAAEFYFLRPHPDAPGKRVHPASNSGNKIAQIPDDKGSFLNIDFSTANASEFSNGNDRDVCYLNSGSLADIDIIKDSFLGCAAGWVEARTRPYSYKLPDDVLDLKPKSYTERVASRISAPKQAAENVPRIVFPEMVVRMTRTTVVGVLEEMLNELRDRSVDPVFWPRRIPTCRRMTSVVYNLLECAPDIVLLGAGLRDHIIDARYGQPAISLDEYRHRLNWVSRTIQQDFESDLIFVLNPPVRDGEYENTGERESRDMALDYAEVAREEVTHFGGTVIDLSEFTAPDGDIDASFRLEVQKATVKKLTTEIRSVAKHRARSTPERSPPFQMNRPVSVEPPATRTNAPFAAIVRFDNNSVLPFAWPQSQKLLYSLRPLVSHRQVKRDEDDVDIDSAELQDTGVPDFPDTLRALTRSKKFVRSLGGRDEREAETQQLISDIACKGSGNAKHRVMLIGDSIRMRLNDGTGYVRHAYEDLNEDYEIIHIPHNCGGTKAVLYFLDDWLSTKPDVIFLNAGLHDLATVAFGPMHWARAEITEYCENLRTIVARIRATTCKTLLWGTNTPVQEEWHRWVPGRKKPKARRIVRNNADIRAYNAASVEIMEELDVPVTDMFTPLWDAGIENVVLPDGVHLNYLGSTILGTLVADQIKVHL